MGMKVRGYPVTLQYNADTKQITMVVDCPDIKDEVDALKRMKEWGIITTPKINVGKSGGKTE